MHLIKKLEKTYTNYKTIIQNFMYMNILKVLTIIVPLITYPYLIRVLGAEQYGLVIWAWAIIELFIIFINFGFDISITKHISINRNNKNELSKILTSTLIAKFTFLIIGFIILLLAITFIDKIDQYKTLFLITFLLTIPEAMMPLWYFKGIEKMKYVAIIVSSIKIIFAISILLIIQDKDDYLLVPVLYAFSGLLSAIFAYYLILIKDKQTFSFVTLSLIIFYIKDSMAIFGTNSITMFREKISILIIERFIGLEAVAYFDIAQKFVNILITPFHILSSTIYPHMSRVKDMNFIVKVIKYTFIVTILAYILQYIFSENITQLLFGKANNIIETNIIILSLTIPFGMLSAFIGINILIVYDKKRELLNSSFIVTIFYFLAIFTLWISNNIDNISNILIIIIGVFILDFIIRLFYAKDLIKKEIK